MMYIKNIIYYNKCMILKNSLSSCGTTPFIILLLLKMILCYFFYDFETINESQAKLKKYHAIFNTFGYYYIRIYTHIHVHRKEVNCNNWPHMYQITYIHTRLV